ncbi:hypothetical protein BOX15_Mlig001753g3 [Macrostomum lignano]|uniref:Uncharacterized protein n=1 Tax=Macrostomum lignano TaxID=282301 RepID=A0A267GMX5_9PLAT|nr:hypothetical protein BOX15_Mlig001753g3 [Macrostomum lignano]
MKSAICLPSLLLLLLAAILGASDSAPVSSDIAHVDSLAVGERGAPDASDAHLLEAEEKRARGFLGKRARGFLGKRARGFLGKRARGFLGKRARGFLGKRSRGFLGKRARGFLGKRNGNYDDEYLMDEDSHSDHDEAAFEDWRDEGDE